MKLLYFNFNHISILANKHIDTFNSIFSMMLSILNENLFSLPICSYTFFDHECKECNIAVPMNV